MTYSIGENQSYEAKGWMRQSQPLVGQDVTLGLVNIKATAKFHQNLLIYKQGFSYPLSLVCVWGGGRGGGGGGGKGMKIFQFKTLNLKYNVNLHFDHDLSSWFWWESYK